MTGTASGNNRAMSAPRPKSPAVPAPVLRTPGKTTGPRGRRTVKSILESARELIQERGYLGTSVEDITTAAGVSRATFWTYFASKQDVLRALGADAEGAGMQLARAFASLPPCATLKQVTEWVRGYLAFLDEYGAFMNAAYQAAQVDPELREWALASEMGGARVLGAGLANLRGGTSPSGVDPLIEGLAVLGMLERFWYKWRVGGAQLNEKRIAQSLAHLIWGTARE